MQASLSAATLVSRHVPCRTLEVMSTEPLQDTLPMGPEASEPGQSPQLPKDSLVSCLLSRHLGKAECFQEPPGPLLWRRSV